MKPYIVKQLNDEKMVPLLFDGASWERNESSFLLLENDSICFINTVANDDEYEMIPLKYFDLDKIKCVHINFLYEPTMDGNPPHAFYLGVMIELTDRICRFKVKDVRINYPKLRDYFQSHNLHIYSNMNIEEELQYSDEILHEKYAKN